MMSRLALAYGAFALLILTGCGSTPGERAVSGAGIGAAAGAVGGALVGSPATGAAIGGAAGAAAGALTDQQDLDLGEPLWKQ